MLTLEPAQRARSASSVGGRADSRFVEIGTDEDHVHFLVQSVPTFSVTTGSDCRPAL